MHVQSAFSEDDEEVLCGLIRRAPLATLIVHTDQIEANHLPLMLGSNAGQRVLRGHIPKANDLWQRLDGSVAGLAVFQGPQAYITPAWYPSKREHGKVVPTWNYVIAHVRGVLRAVHDRQWLRQQVNDLTNQQESVATTSATPWQVSDAPDDYIEKLLRTIVGVELAVESMVGKWKLSQNKSARDHAGVSAGLLERGSSNDIAMTELMTEQTAEQMEEPIEGAEDASSSHPKQ